MILQPKTYRLASYRTKVGRREGHIFTGKYGNINFKIKITHYPTLTCEYNIVQFPTLSTRRDLDGISKYKVEHHNAGTK